METLHSLFERVAALADVAVVTPALAGGVVAIPPAPPRHKCKTLDTLVRGVCVSVHQYHSLISSASAIHHGDSGTNICPPLLLTPIFSTTPDTHICHHP